MKALLIIAIILIAVPASAATYQAMSEFNSGHHRIVWTYKFSVKGTDQPLAVVESSCWSTKENKRIHVDPPYGRICYETEALARVAAQKEADIFEKTLPERMKP